MLVTLLGIVTFVRPSQPLKAYEHIFFTLSPSTTSFIGVPAKQPTIDSLFTSTFVRLLQPLNELLYIFVTLLGIVILIRLRQSENALEPIAVTTLGIITFLMLSLY